MASSKTNPPAPNLATILSIKRKMAAKNPGESATKQLPPAPPAVINSHSNERIAFHQSIPTENPAVKAPTTVPENTDEQPKISRKTKQLEVGLLDKKMEEINRKQEVKTNEALDTWKGFDSFNYGFNSTPGASNTTPGPPVATKQVKYSFIFQIKILIHIFSIFFPNSPHLHHKTNHHQLNNSLRRNNHHMNALILQSRINQDLNHYRRRLFKKNHLHLRLLKINL
jgi:hypothetical protein